MCAYHLRASEKGCMCHVFREFTCLAMRVANIHACVSHEGSSAGSPEGGGSLGLAVPAEHDPLQPHSFAAEASQLNRGVLLIRSRGVSLISHTVQSICIRPPPTSTSSRSILMRTMCHVCLQCRCLARRRGVALEGSDHCAHSAAPAPAPL